jgi:5-methylcytosine-specific restriction endonuclease McrA
MPFAAPHICGCGRRVPYGVTCYCQRARKAEADKRRPNARERGYDSRWQRERVLFLQVNSRCKRCGEAATVVDHIIPHRGNRTRFWDRNNWQALCAHCHNSAKQARERRAQP